VGPTKLPTALIFFDSYITSSIDINININIKL
jgi:hypothetical protein